jgi:N-acetylglucosamine kinase-like BadF-type ATPase
MTQGHVVVNRQLFGGIDGGGTKTLAIVVDENGQEVGRGLMPGSNLQAVGAEEAARRITEALREASGDNLPLAGLCVGLAGVDRPVDREEMTAALSQTGAVLPERLWLGNDAELILLSLPGGQGLGLIAGTGSIALGRDKSGRLVRAGGWGYLIGDEGSGYDLGRKALQVAAKAADGRGPQTLLLPAILKEWKLDNPTQLITVVYDPATRVADFARLSRLVSECAAQGDEVAQQLVKRAVSELARTVEAVSRQLDFGETAPGIALAGGLLLGEPALRRPLLRRLRRTARIGFSRKVSEPAVNAARAALDMFKKG